MFGEAISLNLTELEFLRLPIRETSCTKPGVTGLAPGPSVKGQTANILEFVGHEVPVTPLTGLSL
jgi:hypothetical protein